MKQEYLEKIGEQGQLIVVSGPIGTGKKTIIQEYLKTHENARVSISATTREPYVGEEDGKDYWFVSYLEFERMIRTRQMLEYSYVNNYAYGTPKKAVEDAREKGHNVILDVDVVGAMRVRTLCPDATLIYILPPSWAELQERLKNTEKYDDETIQELMKIAEEDIACANLYDYVLVNESVEKSVERLGQIIHGNRYSRTSMKGFLDRYIEGEINPDIKEFTEALQE